MRLRGETVRLRISDPDGEMTIDVDRNAIVNALLDIAGLEAS